MNNIELKTSDPIYNLEVNRTNVVIGNPNNNNVWGYIEGNICNQRDLMNLVEQLRPKTWKDEDVPLTLTVELNYGEPETTKTNIAVKLKTRGLPSHYRLSEDQSFAGVDWIPFYSNVLYFDINPSKGEHKVYGQLKNQYKESEVTSGTITLI